MATFITSLSTVTKSLTECPEGEFILVGCVGERIMDRLYSSRRIESSLSHPSSSGHCELGPGPEADIKLSRPVPCSPVLTERCQSCSNILGFPCPVGGTSAIKPATVAPCSVQQAAPAHPSLPHESQMCPLPGPCQGCWDSACFLLCLVSLAHGFRTESCYAPGVRATHYFSCCPVLVRNT